MVWMKSMETGDAVSLTKLHLKTRFSRTNSHIQTAVPIIFIKVWITATLFAALLVPMQEIS